MTPPPGSRKGRDEPASLTPVREGEVESTSTWDALARLPEYASNARIEPTTLKANRFFKEYLPNPTDQNDPIKVLQLLCDFLDDNCRLKRTHLNDVQEEICPNYRSWKDYSVKKGVVTLKGQIADPKDAVASHSHAVNPASLGVRTAESMASHLRMIHNGTNAKHLSSILPLSHSISHPNLSPPPAHNTTNEALQLTLTWKAPEHSEASSPLDKLLEEGTVPVLEIYGLRSGAKYDLVTFG
ncbi:hypothetical protein BT69DRAFT_1329322 [Atractiella rhizophila]|nr:hypothetical protein BT69DRAFT_1329322 [Atractiella rhizophila]